MNIPNKIIPQLYLGNIHHARDISLLQNLRIKHVLSIINSHEQRLLPRFYQHNIHNRQFERCDKPTEDLLTIFPETIQFIHRAINVRHENILIHCHMGISRSVTIVAAFLMTKWHLSTQEILLFIRTKRSVCNPNDGFIYQLNLYDRMNYRLDIRNKEFRQYLFYKTLLPFSSIDTIHHMIDRYWTIIEHYEQKQLIDANIQQWYRCRQCSSKIFNDNHLLESNRIVFRNPTTIRSLVRQNILLREISGKQCLKLSDFDSTMNINNDDDSTKNPKSVIDCNRYLIEPLPWMNIIITTVKEMDIDYQLQCPGCSSVIGSIRIESSPKIQCKCSNHCDLFSFIVIFIDKNVAIIG